MGNNELDNKMKNGGRKHMEFPDEEKKIPGIVAARVLQYRISNMVPHRSTNPSSSSALTNLPVSISVSASPVVVTLPRSTLSDKPSPSR